MSPSPACPLDWELPEGKACALSPAADWIPALKSALPLSQNSYLCHHRSTERLRTDSFALPTLGLGMGIALASDVSRGFKCAWVG